MRATREGANCKLGIRERCELIEMKNDRVIAIPVQPIVKQGAMYGKRVLRR